jgi:iron complex outermembrane receptor protein
MAQTASGLAVEEIVVTARKREESILEVPLTITAFSARKIEEYNFRDFTDLQLATPGLTFNEAGNSIRADREGFSYDIRGLNVGGFGQAQSAAALFIDGVPNLFGRLSSFANVERIEVLKGPQTAYFGRNTFSGAINVVTRKPGNEWKGRVTAEGASYRSTDVTLSIEGPIVTDKLAFLLFGQRSDRGGQYKDNAIGGTLGGRKTSSASGTFYATPTDQLSVKVYGEYTEFDDETSLVYNFGGPEFWNCNAAGLAGPRNWICGQIPDTRIARQRIGAPAIFDQLFIDRAVRPSTLFDDLLVNHGGLGSRQTAIHAIVDYEFSNAISLSGSVARHENKFQTFYEATHDGSRGFFRCTSPTGCLRPFGQADFLVEGIRKDFSAEARLTSAQDQRLRWTLGVNYVDGKDIPSFFPGALPNSPDYQFFGFGTYGRSQTYSAFGGLYFDLTEALTLGAEFRHQRDKITRIPVDSALGPGMPSRNPTLILKNTFKANAPRVTLDYDITPEWMVFASWARGFRPGSFNAEIPLLPALIQAELARAGVGAAVDQERLDQFELGAKGVALDNRLVMTVTTYYGRLNDQQVPQGFFFNVPGFIRSVNTISNAGKTEIYGLEFEASATLSESLAVDGSFAWNATKILTDFCADCARLGAPLNASVGKRLENVPEFTAHIAGTYTYPLASTLDAFLRTEYFYTGNKFATRLNLERSGAAHRVNLRIGARTSDYSIEAFVTNVLDDDTVAGHSLQTDIPGFFPTIKIQLPERRQWGIRGTYNF